MAMLPPTKTSRFRAGVAAMLSVGTYQSTFAACVIASGISLNFACSFFHQKWVFPPIFGKLAKREKLFRSGKRVREWRILST
jgi:hypothetical protein